VRSVRSVAVVLVFLVSCASDSPVAPRDAIDAACDARHGEGTDAAEECGAVAYCAMENPEGARLVGQRVDPLELDPDAEYEYISYRACVDPASSEEIIEACEQEGLADCPEPPATAGRSRSRGR
jgi:hypothetical protein